MAESTAAVAEPLPLTFRHYEDSDAPALAAFLDRSFGGWPKPARGVPPVDYLRWKLSSHAAVAEGTILAELDGEIVGSIAAIASEARIGGRRAIVVNAGDGAVAPALQGRGVWSRLSVERLDRWKERFDFLLQDTGKVSAVQHLHGRLGYSDLGNEIVAFGWRTRWPRRLQAVERVLGRARGSRPLALVPISPADVRLGQIYEAASARFDFIRDRTPARLAWRYGDPRGGAYKMLGLEDGRELRGWLCVNLQGGRGSIVDALLTPECDRFAEKLFQEGLEWLRARGARRIRCWLPARHPYRAALERSGFRARRTESHRFLPLAWDSGDVAVLAFRDAKVHLMLGDSDVG